MQTPQIAPKRKRRVGRWIRRAALLLVLIYACFALIPYIAPPTAEALSSDWQAALLSDENVNRATILETGDEALLTRLKLIAGATRSIRAGAYIFATDESGLTISAALLAAAERGVHVELLIDGLIGRINLRGSAVAYALGAHPNIDVKFYNPVNLLDPEGLDARFHEKYFIVDDEWLVMGGRNVSDEFLTDSDDPHYNYDQDVLLYRLDPSAHDAVAQVADYFDALWASDLCQTQYADVSASNEAAVSASRAELLERWHTLQAARDLSPIDPNTELLPVQRTLLMTNPTNAGVKQPVLWKQLCALMSTATDRVWLQTPYLVMNGVMRDDLSAVASQASELRILLNSRNSGNNVMASADYVFHKGMATRLDASLYEFQGSSSMHTKSILIDDDVSVFGSFNCDIRSAYIDTELMLAVYSPELNALLESSMRSMFAQSLETGADGALLPSDTVQPAEGSFGKTLGVYLLSPFVSLLRFLV